MPVKSQIEDIDTEGGKQGQKLTVEFTNGSLQQLKDLAQYYNVKDNDPFAVLEMAIGLLETVREKNGDKKVTTN